MIRTHPKNVMCKQNFIPTYFTWSRVEKMKVYCHPEKAGLVDPRKMLGECALPPSPITFIFMHFSAKTLSNSRFSQQTLGWCPRLGSFECTHWEGQFFTKICLEMRNVSFETWVEAMSNNKTYGDELTLFSLRRIYWCHSVVFTSLSRPKHDQPFLPHQISMKSPYLMNVV